jgi:REP element-mobilizing transposase RayT
LVWTKYRKASFIGKIKKILERLFEEKAQEYNWEFLP